MLPIRADYGVNRQQGKADSLPAVRLHGGNCQTEKCSSIPNTADCRRQQSAGKSGIAPSRADCRELTVSRKSNITPSRTDSQEAGDFHMQQIKKALPIRVEITSVLKKAIYSREYNAGDELSLTGVAEQLGVSRTPVREAFQSLAEEGLITLRMNRGAVVNSIDRKFIRDCFEMRILLESEAAFRAAENGMTADDLLARLHDMSGNAGGTDRETYERLNEDIHMRLWNAADNDRLKRYLMELWNGPSTGHSIAESSQHYIHSTAEHIAILEAVRDHDPQRAKQAMTQHITRSMHNILAKYPE